MLEHTRSIAGSGVARKRFGFLPLMVLLAAALIFFARVLFTSQYLIPWDFRGFHLPLATAVLDAMNGEGSVLWDTTTYCGRPLFADPQAQVFYPPTDLVIFIATFFDRSYLAYILEWGLVLHVFAAGAFTYLLLRRMGVSRAAALCGGLVFELGGCFASQTQHLDVIESAAWIPLMWTAAWEFRNGFSRRWFAVLTVACAMNILAGIPAMAAIAIIATIMFTGLLLLFREMPLRQAGLVPAAVAVGIGSSAIMLVPTAQLVQLSVGKYRTDWFDGRGFPPAVLLSVVMPPDRKTICDLLYCGIGGSALALIGIVGVRQKYFRGAALSLVCLAGLSGIWMLGTSTPFGRAVWAIIPDLLKGGLYPYYAMATFCLGIAALAAIGLDRIQRLSTTHKYAIAVLVAADLIVVGSGRPMNASDLRAEPGITQDQINGSRATLSQLRRLTAGNPPNRWDTHESSPQWSTTAPLTLLPTANGYNPLALERLIQCRLAFAHGFRWGAWYEVENLASPMLDALGVRYILSGKPIHTQVDGMSKFSLRAELPGFSVYENSSALPRFFLVHRIRLVRSAQEAFAGIHRADFKPSGIAVVEETPSPEWNAKARLLQADGAPIEQEDSVRVPRYDSREVALTVRAKAPGFLVTSEVEYPGWRAWIDGSEVPIFMTNGAFRGLVIPAGEHRVEFRFAPRILFLGAGISALSLCAALAICQLLGTRPAAGGPNL